MANLNQCNFIGRCGSDPSVRYTADGKPIANLCIAVTEKYKDKKTTEWVRLVVFSKLAEIIEKYVHKGSLIFISGRLQNREWTDKDGVKRYSTEIVVSTMQMLDGKKQEEKPEANPYEAPRDDSQIPF